MVTNKEGRYTATVLDAHDLEPMFDRVVSGDTCRPRNPTRPVSSTAWRSLVWTARVRCSWATRSIDVATARNGGVTVWALPYGYNMGEPIEACEPDRVIADFSA